MKDLIERLEKLDGKDRRAAVDAFCEISSRITVPDDFNRHVMQAAQSKSDSRAMGYLLLAALTLVPRGAVLQNLTLRMQPEMGGKMYSAVVWHGSLFPSGGQRSFELAVACAALKAREARDA